VGGSAREWSTTIPADLEPGGRVALRLVMTKLGRPGVRVAYELVVE